VRLALWKKAAAEYLRMDSAVARGLLGLAMVIAARLLIRVGRKGAGFRLLARAHRAGIATGARQSTERLARDAAAAARADTSHWLLGVYDAYIADQRPGPKTARYFENPAGMLGPIALVMKAAGDEKGVINLHYSGYFPVFARLFDVEKVARRYYLVLEPSWSGFYDPDLLFWTRYKFPVFVQASEPEDARTLEAIGANLIPTPTAANWWVDHRLFRPVPGRPKPFDAVMIAAWAGYKRHERFFAGLRALKRRGTPLRALLLGYKIDRTRTNIEALARYYGIAELIEAREGIDYEAMNDHVTSAKVGVLWSRREGVNRAVIECLFAGVPCLLREGFNYGFRYPFLNDETGCRVATESQLPDVLWDMVQNHAAFTPRDWVLKHMSCQAGAEALSRVIGEYAAKRGEAWSGGVVPKVTRVHGQEYWDPADAERFAPDYEYLRTCVR
jgi:glycosyltransferase involved in cell wall biosynthesis